MTKIIVLGKKLQPDGSLHSNFIKSLENALSFSKQAEVSHIIISGGLTRKGFQSEAHAGADYLKKRGITASIQLEEKALTTIHNLIYTEKMLADNTEKVLILFTSSSRHRVRCFCRWYAPELYDKAIFMPIKGSFSLRDFLLNLPFWLLQ